MLKIRIVIALLVGAFSIPFFTGCNGEIVIDDGRKTKVSINMSKEQQVQNMLENPDVLPDMRKQLAEIRKKRADLTTQANDFYVESEVAFRRVKRIENEKEANAVRRKKLEDIAKKANLTLGDKTNSVQVGTKTFTGEDVSRALDKYKDQERQANDAIERGNKLAEAYKAAVEKIRSNLSQVDDKIAKSEAAVANYELAQKLLEINKIVGAIGWSELEMDTLLDTSSMLTAMQTEIDKADIQNEIKEQERKIVELNRELDCISLSITDDDLL